VLAAAVTHFLSGAPRKWGSVQLVSFLETLSDGSTTPYDNIDLFTGACRTGGSASPQGKETLMATPALPACAARVCAVAPAPSPPLR